MRTPTFAAALAVGVNVGLFLAKLAVGLISGSVAVLSDAIDSGEDIIAASVALVSVRLSARPPDETHPYGYGKVESIAAGLEAGFISLGAGIIVFQAVGNLAEGDHDVSTGIALVTMAVVAVINLALAAFVRSVGKESDSLALLADATHLVTNAAQAAAILLALSLVAITDLWWLDPAVALALAAYLLWMAFRIVRRALGDVTDVRLPRHEEEVIVAAIAATGGVRGYHRLRTRRSGPYRELDLHLILDPGTPLSEVHEICDRLEDRILEQFPRSTVVIHAEPDDGRPLTLVSSDRSPVISSSPHS